MQPVLSLRSDGQNLLTLSSTSTGLMSSSRAEKPSTGNGSMPKIIINDTINLIFKTAISVCVISTVTVSECCLMKLLPYILSEKYIHILALEMASPGNRHCANCIGALSFPRRRTLPIHATCSACSVGRCAVLYPVMPQHVGKY